MRLIGLFLMVQLIGISNTAETKLVIKLKSDLIHDRKVCRLSQESIGALRLLREIVERLVDDEPSALLLGLGACQVHGKGRGSRAPVRRWRSSGR
jgi:hypothetical protein